MDKEQLKKLFVLLKNTYPKFEVTQEKVDIWSRLLKNNDGEQVIKHAERYVLNNRYPPTIADIKAPPKPEAHRQDYLENIKKWESEASGKPEWVDEEIRRIFKR